MQRGVGGCFNLRVSSTVGPDVIPGVAPEFPSFNSATKPSILTRGGSVMLLAASETLEENSESGNEMSVSVEPPLGERPMANREFVSEARGQHRGNCSRAAPIPSPSAFRVMSAPWVGGGGRKLT